MYLDSMIMRGTLVASGVTHHAGICVPDVAISHYCQPYYHDAFFLSVVMVKNLVVGKTQVYYHLTGTCSIEVITGM